MTAEVIRLSLELAQQPRHVSVSGSVRRLAVYVVTEVGVTHHEHGDVGDAAHVRELDQLVLHQAAVDPHPEQGLDQGHCQPDGNAYGQR